MRKIASLLFARLLRGRSADGDHAILSIEAAVSLVIAPATNGLPLVV